MKNKECIASVLVAVVVMVALAVYVLFGAWIDTTTDIDKGFSDKLVEGLKTQYEITIPENAVFIKGINFNSFRNYTVVVLFTCPIGDYVPKGDGNDYLYVAQVLKLPSSRYTNGFATDEWIAADWYEEMGGKLDRMFSDKTDPFTRISWSINQDELTVRIVGKNPHATFP